MSTWPWWRLFPARKTLRRGVLPGLVGLLLLRAATTATASDWPAFRGPHGDGLSEAKGVPLNWSDTENVRWKAPLPRPGNGSAIVIKDRVFVTSAEDAAGHERSLLCYRLADGTLDWKRTVHVDKELPTHKTNLYCGTTPAANDQAVVVWHATGGLHAYDHAGNPLWSRDLGEFRHIWGYGSSPILDGGRVILHSGPGTRVFLAAFDLKTGKTIWETPEPVEGDGSNTPDRRYFGSWATPLLAEIGGTKQLVVAMPTRVCGYDPADGRLLWWCDGLRHGGGDLAYSSPLLVGKTCVMTGGFNGPAIAFPLGGSGDLTSSRLWRTEKNPQSIGSGIVAGDHFIRPNAGPGTLECLDPQTGKIVWTARGPGGNMWASIVEAEGRAYATAQNGTTVVFRPDPKGYEELARNRLDDSTNATPAVTDGTLVFRMDHALICVGR